MGESLSFVKYVELFCENYKNMLEADQNSRVDILKNKKRKDRGIKIARWFTGSILH
jgi:hypothetical protein